MYGTRSDDGIMERVLTWVFDNESEWLPPAISALLAVVIMIAAVPVVFLMYVLVPKKLLKKMGMCQDSDYDSHGF